MLLRLSSSRVALAYVIRDATRAAAAAPNLPSANLLKVICVRSTTFLAYKAQNICETVQNPANLPLGLLGPSQNLNLGQNAPKHARICGPRPSEVSVDMGRDHLVSMHAKQIFVSQRRQYTRLYVSI